MSPVNIPELVASVESLFDCGRGFRGAAWKPMDCEVHLEPRDFYKSFVFEVPQQGVTINGAEQQLCQMLWHVFQAVYHYSPSGAPLYWRYDQKVMFYASGGYDMTSYEYDGEDPGSLYRIIHRNPSWKIRTRFAVPDCQWNDLEHAPWILKYVPRVEGGGQFYVPDRHLQAEPIEIVEAERPD